MSDSVILDPEEFRKSWNRFAELFGHAVNNSQAQAIPEVHDVLLLLGEAVLALAADVNHVLVALGKNQ